MANIDIEALKVWSQGMDSDERKLSLALKHLNAEIHGFGAGDIAGIEAFWGMTDADFQQGAFVLALQDGRRFQVDYFVDDLSPEYRLDGSTGHREGINIEALAKGQRFAPTMPADVWSNDIEDLNAFLQRRQEGAPVDQMHLPY